MESEIQSTEICASGNFYNSKFKNFPEDGKLCANIRKVS
jgi:hypothetical protein